MEDLVGEGAHDVVRLGEHLFECRRVHIIDEGEDGFVARKQSRWSIGGIGRCVNLSWEHRQMVIKTARNSIVLISTVSEPNFAQAPA